MGRGIERLAVKRWTDIRKILLFLGGYLGVAHETLVAGATERPWLLATFIAMMALPVPRFLDEMIQRRNDEVQIATEKS